MTYRGKRLFITGIPTAGKSYLAKSFWEVERPFYKEQAEKFGYPVFDSADQAFEPALKLIS